MPLDTDRRLVQLSPADNVAATAQTLAAGQVIVIAGQSVTLRRDVPTGHKIALKPIAAGAKVLKYGAPIGTATCDICVGDYVHTHNVRSDYLPTRTLAQK